MWGEENDKDKRRQKEGRTSLLLLQNDEVIFRHSWESPGKDGRVGTEKATQAYHFVGHYKAKQEIASDEDGCSQEEAADL